jgi:hypothetical protein
VLSSRLTFALSGMSPAQKRLLLACLRRRRRIWFVAVPGRGLFVL